MLGSADRSARLVRVAAALAIAALAALASAAPADWQVDRTAVMSGELWRLWTGHFVHASHDHLVYDVGAAAAVALCCGDPRRWFAGFAWMAPLISALLLLFLPSLDRYYGLSALLHASVVVIAGSMWRNERGPRAALGGLLGLGTIAKAALETTTQSAPLTGSLDMGGPVVYASHLIGALCGAAVCLRGATSLHKKGRALTALARSIR